MTFLWCILALSLALVIARYNQSNKLFWILFISFLGGIASAAIYDKVTTCQDGNQSKQKVTITACPTQDVQGNILDLSMLLPATADNSKGNAPASKDYMSYDEPKLVLTQWVKDVSLPPPQTINTIKLCCTHISTHHDDC